MPPGQAYTDPEELPEQFQEFSRDAKTAAMDAYNGAIADDLPTGEAIAIAQRAAQEVDGGEAVGRSDETYQPTRDPEMNEQIRNAGPASPQAGGGRNMVLQTETERSRGRMDDYREQAVGGPGGPSLAGALRQGSRGAARSATDIDPSGRPGGETVTPEAVARGEVPLEVAPTGVLDAALQRSGTHAGTGGGPSPQAIARELKRRGLDRFKEAPESHPLQDIPRKGR